ncbi:PREDICTED: cancer/testis antigen 55 [Chinchilla lanigera]|uniref:cancer/testis antigen 55 n=1 Tax=Chinchilla lanigera TaxID=34839 RepID=UPI000697536A|nr:PREDICTED: cancer/testis antigen 55 [Chinchilla lanigera]
MMSRLLSRAFAFFQRRREDRDEGHRRLLPEINPQHVQIEPVYDHFNYSGPSEPERKVLIGCVSSIMDGTVSINKEMSFRIDSACEGFVPYMGDWLEVVYSLDPETALIKAHAVKPMNCRHVDKVKITSVRRRHGVIDNSIFFTLDSLNLPADYIPQLYDVVNVVVVQSSQSFYMWRALSLDPLYRCY